MGISKGRERERGGAIPSRQGGKGRGGGALGELRGEVLVLGVASGGGGVLGAVEVRWLSATSRQELCSRVVARPGDTARVFIATTSSRGWWLHPGLVGSL